MTFDAQVQSLTQDYIVPVVTDSVLQSNLLALLILSAGKPWIGETLKFPVKLTSATQGGSFSDYSEFKIANESTRQVAAFDARAYYQSVVIGGISRSVNNISKSQVLNLVKVEMESIYQDMVDGIGTILNSDGTGNSSQDFLGTVAAIDDGTTVATYGTLSRSANTKWQSVLSTSIGTFDFAKMRTLWNNATVGSIKPTLAQVNKSVFGFMEAKFQATVNGRYDLVDAARVTITRGGMKPAMDKGLVGVAGFDGLYFAGTPVVKDDKTQSGKCQVINTDYLRWYGVDAVEADPVDLSTLYVQGNDYDNTDGFGAPSTQGFAWTGFVRPAKQYAFIGQLLLLGNMLTPAPRLHSIGSGISG